MATVLALLKAKNSVLFLDSGNQRERVRSSPISLVTGRSRVNGDTWDLVPLTFQLMVLSQELFHLLQQLLWGECVQVRVSQIGGSISRAFIGAVSLFSQAAKWLMGHDSSFYGKVTR